ncbi:MAG: hypothetical protein KGS60_04365 [Verrucomicrobia bacterium]|nr:hypothetical protein [Verrucomicrobiota bacterium]
MLTERDKLMVLRRHTVLRSALLADARTYRIRWVERESQPTTGAWRLNPEEGHNEILLNECLDELAELPVRPGGLALETYLHEVAHSMWSEGDFQRLGDLLKEQGIPFIIHNLFEDARIEARWRREFGHRFQWLRWNRPQWEYEFLFTTAPEAVFLGLITIENQRQALAHLLRISEAAGPETHARTLRILHFYRLATRKGSPYIGSTTDLVPLCRRWLDEFPRPAERGWQPATGSIHGDDYRSTPGAAPGSRESSPPEPPDGLPEPLRDWDAKSRAALWRPDCNRGHFNNAIGSRLETLVAKALPGGVAKCKTLTAGKHLSLRDHVRGSERFYRAKRAVPEGIPHVALVVDCSGSMWHDPHLAGLTLLQIFNHLHLARKIFGHVYLTYGTGSTRLPLPFDDDILFSLDCDGPCEGIEACFEAHRAELCRADVISVYTDGNILDTPFDRKKWHRLGIETYGLYVGSTAKVDSLKTWFDHVLVRANIEQLVIAWTHLLQRHRASRGS